MSLISEDKKGYWNLLIRHNQTSGLLSVIMSKKNIITYLTCENITTVISNFTCCILGLQSILQRWDIRGVIAWKKYATAYKTSRNKKSWPLLLAGALSAKYKCSIYYLVLTWLFYAIKYYEIYYLAFKSYLNQIEF